MEKGKHAQEKSRRGKKRKLAWGKIVVPISSIVIICFIIGNINFNENLQNEEGTDTMEVSNEEIEPQEVVIEPTEDESMKALIEEIKQENNLTENNFAFFYYNEDTKKYYFFNENKYFTAASTVKVPVAMIYYDKINSGELNLDDTLVYAKGCYEAGGGTTASTYKVSQNVPINFLLEQAVVNSDNTAVNILINNLGWKQYRYDIAQYTEEELYAEFYESNLTSGAYAYDLLTHLYENRENYSQLIDYMKISSNGLYLKKYLQDYDVAHKYGSYNGYVHDYGIVFGDTNYLIGVYTKGVPSADELIANIGSEVNALVNGTSMVTGQQ